MPMPSGDDGRSMPFERGRRPHARPALVLVVTGTLLVSACSLVSGWSDLQGGRDDDGGDATVESSSGSSGSSGASGTSGTSGTSGATDDASTTAYPCGATRCGPAPAIGCCVTNGAAPQCADLAQCKSAGGFWIGCDRSSACTGPAATACCWNLATNSSRCMSQCANADVAICHPDEGDCKAPKLCVPGAGGLSDLYQCN